MRRPASLTEIAKSGLVSRWFLHAFAAAWLSLFVPLHLSAQSQPAPLASLQYRIVGTQLQVSPAAVSVPKGIPGSVLVQFANGDGSTSGVDTSMGNGAYVEATLRGPSFPARRLVGQVGQALMLPTISLVGDYELDNIRLVDSVSGATRLEGNPSTVPVHVFDQVLISTVTSRPLSVQEITDKGIVVDANNFRAVEFEVGFVLDGQNISIKLPVVAPDFTQSTEIIPSDELERRLVEAQQINDQLSQQLVESGSLAPELQRPGLNIQIKGANFQLAGDDEAASLKLTIPPIPALIVIPGNIGFLNQFFSVKIFTENGAPIGSGLSVFDVMAKLNLPPGPDGILSTNYNDPGDDPLRFARVGPNAEIHDTLQLFGPPPGNANRLNPGQTGTAEFLVEGLQEGLQVMNLDLTANLDGLAAGTVKITGKAAGSVLVRNPKFSMSFSHPKTIRSGEPYTAYVTILNTGNVDANLVSVTLRGASISGGVLQSPEVVQLGTLSPGQSGTASFRILAQRTGSIKFDNLTTGDNSVQGRFNLTMGIDERGVELSPDSIGMPDFVNYLPQPVLDTANRVLGQALSAATAPILPPGVLPVSRATITRHVLELAEAGQRIKYLEATNRVLADLLLDWQGGRTGNDLQQQQIRLNDPSLNQSSSAPLVDQGFDQIIRSTDAGYQFRSALLQTAEATDGVDDTTRLIVRASDFAGRSEPWLLASSSDTNLESGSVGAAGVASPARSDLPYVAVYPGLLGNWLAELATTNVVRWTAKSNLTSAHIAVVLLNTNGTGLQWQWTVTNVLAGACFSFDPSLPGSGLQRDDNCDGTPDSTLVANSTPVHELPPQVLTVVQDIDVNLSRPARRCSAGPANNYGQVLGVLFSKPMLQTNAAIPDAYQLDNSNSASGVQVQPGGRIALISMKEGVSAIRPRQLTVTGVTDERGNSSIATPVAILSNFRDGVAVNGRVLRADGTPAAGVPVTVTMYDPWRDPFDRCEPIIITRTSQKYTDANGLFTFDFVHAGVGFTIAAVDTGGLSVDAIETILNSTVGDRFAAEKLAALAAATNAFASLGVTTLADATRMVEGLDRAVWSDNIDFNGGRVGHEIVVGLRFRGRAIVSGIVLAPDGVTPVPNAGVNLYPDPDSRELGRGLFTDTSGKFEFNGVPLGQFTVNVQTGQGNFRTVAGNLTQVGETNNIQIILSAPVQQEIVRANLSGRVVEADGVTPNVGAKVFVESVNYGVMGALTTDSDGYWQLNNIPIGDVTVRAFSQDNRRAATSTGTVVTNTVAFILTTLSGTGTVVGRVETSAGLPVANAIIAGGEVLVRSDTNGLFRLTGVPQGQQNISAGLEAQYAPGGFPRVATASVTVLPDIDNTAVIRLPAVGQIIGRVIDANGNPVTGGNVAIPMPQSQGFAWAKLDTDGRFTFPNMGLGDYIVSSPSPPVDQDAEDIINQAMGGTDDQIAAALQDAVTAVNQVILRRLGDGPAVTPGSFGWTTASLRFDGDTAIANIQFLPEGKANGTVVNDQGVPIAAKVRLTGPGLDGLGQPTTLRLGDLTSDPATGLFSFPRLPQGSWALQAASPFYPVVVVTNGTTFRDTLDVTNVTLQFPPIRDYNGRLVGNILMPEGSPAGAGVNVHISFSSDYVIRTDTNGFFDTQIKIPANSYTVEATDPNTGLRGIGMATVQAGITNSVTVTLLGKGSLLLTVLQADGRPAINAPVEANGLGYPYDQYSGFTDTNGAFFLDNIFQGRYGLKVTYTTGAAQLEGNIGIDVSIGTTNTGLITLGPTGTIRGVFRNSADGTPISAARISIGNSAYPSTDSNGFFQSSGLNLGTYRVVGREPVSGRLAVAFATLSYQGQTVDVTLTPLSQGELRGTVTQTGEAAPIAGATVTLSRNDGLIPNVTITTGPDGTYSFPAVTPGQFSLDVNKAYSNREGYQRLIDGTYPDNTTSLTVDVTLPPRTVYGNVVVQVYQPDGGTPATNAVVNGSFTDANGQAGFTGLTLGTQTFIAHSTVTNQTSSGGIGTVTLSALQTNASVTIVLSGVGRIHGRVLESDGVTPSFGADVQASAYRGDFQISRNAAALTDTNGEFVLEDFPVAPFQVSAISGSLASSTSGVITNSGQTADVILQLGASGTVVGRLLRADGTTVVAGNQVTLTFKAPSGLAGIASASTDSQGRFEFDVIPVGAVDFTAVKLDVNGLAKAHATLTTNGQLLDLGDQVMHEDWPYVVSVSPDTGSQDISTSTGLQLVFSEPIETNSIFSSGIYLRGPTNVVPANLSWDAPTNGDGTWVIRLTPKAPLVSQTTYRVYVLSGQVQDGLGNTIGQGPLSLVDRPLLVPYSSSFTTRDDVPPWLVSLFPTNGAVQIDPLAVPRLSFSEPISSTNLSVSLVGPSGPVSGAWTLGFNGTVLTFTPDQPLAINSTYTLTVDGVRDLSGNLMTNLPVKATFNTLDTIGPNIATLQLANGQQPIGGAPVQLEAILATSEPGVNVHFTGNLVPLGTATNAPFRIPVTLPASGTIAYRAIATDQYGNDGPFTELDVTVVADQPPVVTLLKGAPGNGPVPSGGTFGVGVSATSALPITNVAVNVSVPGLTNFVLNLPDGSSRNLLFTLPANAVAGTAIQVRANATDILGLSSADSTVSWIASDGTPPTITLLSPAAGALLNLNQPLVLQLATVDNGTNLHIHLVTQDGLLFTNDLDLPLTPNVAVTNPIVVPMTNAIRTGGDLVVNLTATDGGTNSVSLQRSFILPDITPPRLTNISPTNGATGLSLWDLYRDFTFSEPLADASITTNYFAVTNNAGLVTPYSLQTFGNTVRVGLGSPLKPGTIYTNLLLPGITDRATNALVDADGSPLPAGTNFTLVTAAILSVSPTNNTPVLGGDTVHAAVSFEAGLGARYIQFALSGGSPVTVPLNYLVSTSAAADLVVPLDTSNLVVTIRASDDAAFSRPLTLAPISLIFTGDKTSNQPPSIQITRVNPPGGPVALGQTFTLGLIANDDFGVTNLTFGASGAISTNVVFGAISNVLLTFTVPTNASPGQPLHFVATATDNSGVSSTNSLDISVLALQYPFAYGTMFYSRGPAAQGSIWAVDPTGNAESQITSGSLPMISPDGHYLLFGRDTTGDRAHNNLYVRDLSTGLEQIIANENNQFIVDYDWLNSSTNLLYDYSCEIDQVDWNGANFVRFAAVSCYDDAPSINRIDGRVVCHNTSSGGLILFDSNGGNRRQIPNTVNGDNMPSWSLDGEWISFFNGSNLYKIRPDGYDRTQLSFLTQTGDGLNPIGAWTADASQILVAGTINGTNGIWSVSANGGGLRLIKGDSSVNYGFVGRVFAPATNGLPPLLTSTTPTAGSSNQSLWTTNVTLAFNRAIASATISTNSVLFSVANYSVASNGSRIFIQPNLPLKPGLTYTSTVTAGLKDQVGHSVTASNVSFATARILNVIPTNSTVVQGGTYVNAAVDFDSGMGANYFSFALNASAPAVVAVPSGATHVSAPLLVPLNTPSLVVHIAASSDSAFSAPYFLPDIVLNFGGNSGTNAPPVAQLTVTSPAGGHPLPGDDFSVLLTGQSSFGVSNMTLTISGAVTGNYSFIGGGPVALTLPVASTAVPGSAIILSARVTDMFGVASTNVLNLTVATPPPTLPVNTILYSRVGNPDGSVWRVGLDGSSDQLITTGEQPRISPDNRFFLFGRDKANVSQKNIYLHDLLTGDESLLFAHNDYVVFYDWTPDSSQVVFDYSCVIDMMKRDGSNLRTVLNGNCYDDAPSVDRLTGRIAWQNDRSGNGLYIANSDFSGRTLVPNSLPGDYWTQWSPDGQWLAFYRSTCNQLYKVHPDGSGLTALTTFTMIFGDGPAVWTADGANLVFAATIQGTNGIFEIPANATGTLKLIPTTAGSNIQAVTSVVAPSFTPASAGPALVSVSPANGATSQPLWPATMDFLFSKPLKPASVTASDFQVSSTNGPVAFTFEVDSNLVRLHITSPLLPGISYTNLLLPGPTGLDGTPATLAGNAPIPAGGVPFGFTTAAINSVTPTNGTTVVAGQSFSATVNFDPNLAASYFRFRLSSGGQTIVPVPFGFGSVSATLALPANATSATLSIDAADDLSFARAISLPPIVLNVISLGSQLAINAPSALSLTRGDFTNLLITASSGFSPLQFLGLSPGLPLPPFASFTATQLTNTTSSGTAGFTITLDTTIAAPGTYVLPIVARTTLGTSLTNTLTLTISDNPGLAVTQWKSPVNGNWSDAANWTAGVPGPALPAIINVPGTYTISFTTDASVGSVIVGASSGVQTLDLSGHALRIQNSGRFDTNSFVLLGSALGGTGFIDVAGQIVWSAGNIEIGGPLNLLPGAQIIATNSATHYLFRVLNNQGSIVWQAGNLQMDYSGSPGTLNILPGGLLDLQTDTFITYGTLLNSGTIQKSGPVKDPSQFYTTLNTTFRNDGVVNLFSGGLDLQGTSTSTGSFQVATNTTLYFDGSGHTLTASSQVTGSGEVTFQNATTELNGTYGISGLTYVRATAHFNQPNGTQLGRVRLTGTLGGTGPVTITNSLSWESGEFDIGGPVSFSSNCVATISTTATKFLFRTLNNYGSIVWQAGDLQMDYSSTPGTLNNLVGASIDMQGDFRLTYGSFNNLGFFQKSGAPEDPTLNYATLNTTLRNDGLMRLLAGGLDIFNGSTPTGRFETVTNTMLYFDGNGHTLGVLSSLTGDGDVGFWNGTSEVLGTYAPNGLSYIRATARFDQPSGVQLGRVRLSGTLGGAANVVITNSLLWESGTMDVGSAVTLTPSCLASITTGNGKNLFRVMNNYGTIAWQGGDWHLDYSGTPGTLYNYANALFDMHGDLRMYDGYGVFNSGLMRKSAGTATGYFRSFFENDGLLFVDSGTLQFDSGGHHHGSFNVSSGNVLLFSGGTHVLDNGAVIAGPGQFVAGPNQTVNFNSGSVLDCDFTSTGGTVNFNAGCRTGLLGRHVSIAGLVNFNSGSAQRFAQIDLSGTLGGSDPVTVDQVFNWTGGVMTDSGATTLSPGGTMTLSGNSDKLFAGSRVFNNAGTVTFTGSGRWFVTSSGSAIINNLSGALIDLQTDSPWGAGYWETLVFNNSGTLRKSAGTGTTVFGTTSGGGPKLFNNNGLVQINSGTFQVQGVGNSTNSGSFAIASGSAFEFNSGTHWLAPGSAITGAGELHVLNGEADFQGNYTAAISVSGGTANFLANSVLTLVGNSLTVNGGTLNFNPGSTLNGLTGNLNILGGTANFSSQPITVATLTLGGTLGGSGNVTVQQTINWTGGTMTDSGITTLAAGGTMSLSGSSDKLFAGARVFNNSGTVTFTGSGRWFVTSSGSAVINNLSGALIDLQTDSPWGAGYWETLVFNNSGTLRKSAGTGTTVFGTTSGGGTKLFNNNGVVQINSGTFQVQGVGASTNTGSFALAAGSALEFNSGTHWVQPSASVSGSGILRIINGELDFAGSSAIASLEVDSGTFNLVSGASVTGLASLNIAGGTANFNSGQPITIPNLALNATLGGNGAITVSQVLNWTGGQMTDSGTTTLASGATMNLSGSNDKYFAGARVFNNAGTITWSGSGRWFVTSSGAATINNQSGALIDLQTDSPWGAGYWESLTFNNSGTLRKSGGSGTTVFGANNGGGTKLFNNNGTVQVDSGTIQIQGVGASTNTGSFALSAGTALEFNSGTHWLQPGATVSGSGIFRVINGEVDFAASSTVPSWEVDNGTLNLVPGASLTGLTNLNIAGGTGNFNSGQPSTIPNLTLNGTLGGNSALTVNQVLNWTGGQMTDSGTTTLASGATMNLSGSNDKYFAGARVFNNAGTIIWTGSGRWFVNSSGSATINNLSSGLIDIQTDSSWGAGYWESLTLNNAGTVRKSAGTGTTLFGANNGGGTKLFNNNGLLQVASGTFQVQGYGNSTNISGTFSLAPATTLDFNSGSHGFTNCTFTGSGTNHFESAVQLLSDVSFGTLYVSFDNGSAVSGNYTIANKAGGTLLFNTSLTLPGSLDGAGNVIVANSGLTVQVSHTFTLEATGILNNPGTFKAGAFVNNGGTVIGNAPVVIGLPPAGQAQIISLSLATATTPSRQFFAVSRSPQLILSWTCDQPATFVIQTSQDLLHWQTQTATFQKLSGNQYQASLQSSATNNCFIRVLSQPQPPQPQPPSSDRNYPRQLYPN